MILDVLFAAFLVLVFGYGMYEVRDIPQLARIFPFWISLIAFVLSLIQLGISTRNLFAPESRSTSPFAAVPAGRDSALREVYGKALYYTSWLLGLYAAIWFIGFVIAMTLFVLMFLRWEAQRGWASCTIMSLSSAVFLVGISWLMTLYWPEGRLGLLLELPWPLN